MADGRRLHHVVDHSIRSLRVYVQPMRVRSDVVAVCSRYKGLAPSTGQIGGRRPAAPMSHLLFLTGTIPIVYKGQSYNIPMQFWIPENYSIDRPMAFVTPTQNMVVKDRHPHVDQKGIVYHPFISDWHAGCNLTGLVEALIQTFSKDPPVRARPPQQRSGGNEPQYASHPSSASFSSPSPAVSAASSPHLSAGSSGNSSTMMPRATPAANGRMTSTGTDNAGPSSLTPTPFVVAGATLQTRSTPQLSSPSNAPQSAPPTLENRTSLTQSQRSALAEVAVFQLQDKLRGFNAEIIPRIDRANREGEKMEQKNRDMNAEITHLQREKTTKDISQVEAWLRDNALSSDGFDVDRDTQPKNVVNCQLLRLIAEDAALDDLLYQLSNAVHKEALSAEEYVRTVRRITREQFITRALIKKITAMKASA